MPDPLKQDPETIWDERAQQARDRHERLVSFGPYARGLYVETPEGSFVLDPEDGFISPALLNEGVYNDGEYKVLKSIVSKESDVLVVGAHIGAHAIRLARHCRHLIAIEANPRTYKYLRANVRLNECTNITTYGLAAGDKNEKIQFLMSRENSGGSKRMPVTLHPAYVYDHPETIEIEARPLDELIGPHPFELVLMDIEGSEYFALKGMPQILNVTRTLSIEFMPHMVKNVANVSARDFLDLLLPHFQWMCVPRHNCVYPQAEIGEKLWAMYDAGENHESVFFLKDPLPDWLLQRRR